MPNQGIRLSLSEREVEAGADCGVVFTVRVGNEVSLSGHDEWAQVLDHIRFPPDRGSAGKANDVPNPAIDSLDKPVQPLAANMNTDRPLRIGISACLLGEKVRHDGGHKRDPFLVETLGPHVEWVPICPEVDLGLGTPRETIRLVRDPRELDGVRLSPITSGINLTRRMRRYARQRVRALTKEDLSGYILKKGSPSCGMERVKVWSDKRNAAERRGRGLFAAELIRQHPNLPVEEEGRLQDPQLRENFFDRTFAYRRLRVVFSRRWTVGTIVRFHTSNKLVLMAHSVEGYRKLGRLVAQAKQIPRVEFARRYEDDFMATMAKLATPTRHAKVLMHIVGHFKPHIDKASRDEVLSVIQDYRRQLLPLIVPITLLRHHARRHEVDYLLGQSYLDLDPKELALRNHV